MLRKEIPDFDTYSNTKNRILNAAAKLFALKSFDAVSLKDIANDVGIKIASIYYYYEDKDALIRDVSLRFEKTYREYLEWLSCVNKNAESLEEVMDNLFNSEFLERLNPVACLGISMTLKEQHSDESASERTCKLIYEETTQNIQSCFDRMIEKNIIPPSDTKMLTMLFLFGVMSCNDIYVRDFSEMKNSIDYPRIYNAMRKIVTAALTQGILNIDE